MSAQQASRRNLISRACDRCKARKSKCSGSQPCQQCLAAAATCSYLIVQRMRGPPKSRTRTMANRRPVAGDTAVRPQPTPIGSPTPASRLRSRIVVSALSPILALYQTTMFSVWPIVDTGDLISRLNGKSDLYDYALALATAAATLSQLKATVNLPGQCPSAELCEAECQRVRYTLQRRDDAPNLTWLRVAFFLHAYHENRQRGSVKSFLYLREAISLAQLMDLYDETSHQPIPIQQVCLRKRVFWLLFITERGNSVFHHLPVQLVPALQPFFNDTALDLHRFEPLEIIAHIFTAIDHSGLCCTLGSVKQVAPEGTSRLDSFDSTLRWVLSALHNANDIHKADIFVTVCWARVLLWKAAQPLLDGLSVKNRRMSSPWYPLHAAEEMIASLEELPPRTIEAHGVGIQFKIFDIASTLIEYAEDVAYTDDLSGVPGQQRRLMALKRLHDILTSIRDANKQVISRLFDKAISIASHSSAIPLPIDWGNWNPALDKNNNIIPSGDADRLSFTIPEALRVTEELLLEQTGPEYYDNDFCVDDMTMSLGIEMEEAFDISTNFA